MMTKVLFFFPVNPAEKNEGNKMRAFNLLKYFRCRNIEVDFVGQHNAGSRWSTEDMTELEKTGLVNSIHILHRKPLKTNLLKYFFKYKIANFWYRRSLEIPSGSIPDYTTSYLRGSFNRILKNKRYDFVIISYAQWANLIRDNPFLNGATTIIDTHDFISSQYQVDYRFKLGPAISEEIRRLDLFDEIWAISSDELYFFSQFCKKTVRLLTMMVDSPATTSMPKEFDVIYVASHNEHNKRSAKWFLDHVYPLLQSNIKIAIVGRITESISESQYPNVQLVRFAKDLDSYYRKSRIAICPMLSGTGIKVKVVEALSHSLPVVCTTRGVDGLPDKSNNGCTITDDAFQFAEAIATLLNNEQEYQQQRTLAKNMFLRYFDTNKCHAILDRALKK